MFPSSSRPWLTLLIAFSVFAPAIGQDGSPQAVWYEAQHWSRPVGTPEAQRFQVGAWVPLSEVTGTVELDVRVAAFHRPQLHSPGRVQYLKVGLTDGPRHRIPLDWVPTQELEAQTENGGAKLDHSAAV